MPSDIVRNPAPEHSEITLHQHADSMGVCDGVFVMVSKVMMAMLVSVCVKAVVYVQPEPKKPKKPKKQCG